MSILLSARGLHHTYGDTVAVRNLNFDIHEGEIVTLLGPNGAGKSTTMRMLTALLEPTRGEVRYLSYKLPDNMIEAKSLFGFVADQPMILPYLTGWEYIQFVGGLYGVSQNEIEAYAMSLVERFKLTDAIHKRATGYSHGMQQKLALIAQLAHRPRVLVADEPTVGLDPASATEMQQIFREYCQAGNAILLSTHLLEMANAIATRIMIMFKGEIIAEGSPNELYKERNDSLQNVFLRLTREVATK